MGRPRSALPLGPRLNTRASPVVPPFSTLANSTPVDFSRRYNQNDQGGDRGSGGRRGGGHNRKVGSYLSGEGSDFACARRRWRTTRTRSSRRTTTMRTWRAVSARGGCEARRSAKRQRHGAASSLGSASIYRYITAQRRRADGASGASRPHARLCAGSKGAGAKAPIMHAT